MLLKLILLSPFTVFNETIRIAKIAYAAHITFLLTALVT